MKISFRDREIKIWVISLQELLEIETLVNVWGGYLSGLAQLGQGVAQWDQLIWWLKSYVLQFRDIIKIIILKPDNILSEE